MSIEFKRTEHSDIIVHWTGRDIDARDPEMQKALPVNWRKYCLRPIEKTSLIKNPNIIEDYVERLRDILKFGLWMKNDESLEERKKKASCSDDDGRLVETPDIARVCFTELKLSESRKHAYEYGRLGIGVKRMFLFDRAGQPMVYAGETKGHGYKPNWFYRRTKNNNVTQLDKIQRSFLKYMSELEDLNYKYYSETEWRIVCPDNISEDIETLTDIRKYFIDINGDLEREIENYKKINQVRITTEELKEFIDKNRKKGLRFLVPLDYWLAIIIYPCPAVKIVAEQDDNIRELIRGTRTPRLERYHNLLQQDETQKYNNLEQLGKLTVGSNYMMPMEIDLDTISHF